MTTILEGYSRREMSRLRTRFWAHVHPDGRDHDLPEDACWIWQGSTFQNGHPAAGTKRRIYPARFIAYALEVEDFKEGHHILAMCRNEMCVNPAHMRLVTRRPENDASPEMKLAAHTAVNTAVWQYGSLPQVSTQACADCGAPATGYHHHLGYEPDHWLDVTPLCTVCHRRAEWKIIREQGPITQYL